MAKANTAAKAAPKAKAAPAAGKAKAAPVAKPAAEAKAAKPAPAPKDTANGVTRPRKGSATGRIWDMSDALAKGGKSVKRGDVLAKADEEGINAATAATQFGKWRRYNGITGREAAE